MINKTFTYILSISILSLFAFTTHTEKSNANKKNSSIIWTGSKPTGSHTGNVTLKNGYLSFDHGRLVEDIGESVRGCNPGDISSSDDDDLYN